MKNKTGDIIFIFGMLLILAQVFILDNMSQSGSLIVPQYVNFATLIYDLMYWLGLCPLGIIGLVLIIIGARYMSKSNKK
jgi:hypothetical protein